ncbi:MAG TPA: hypothetical protein VLV90_03120 [Burkholderiales bacterium]|nr:hypothetical protein [Burkholderiales bacterium]
MRPASAVLIALVAALAAAPGAVAQGDAERGRLLYETNCLGCHYERIHNRDAAHSRIVTRAGLRAEVAERYVLTGRPYTRDDVDDIAEYLDRSHYRLKK